MLFALLLPAVDVIESSALTTSTHRNPRGTNFAGASRDLLLLMSSNPRI
ncbi:MAG: hypothetical protein IKJ49_03640 [Bacteroidaceae bacterium]|nr:hypothetical protein [Bacteroidaceae bacterium]